MSSKDSDKIVRSFREKLEELEDVEGKHGEIKNKNPLTGLEMGTADDKTPVRSDRKLSIQFRSINYAPYEQPRGWLVKDKACHALWHYYLFARNNYENEVVDPQVLEGQDDPRYNYKQLFSSIARMYGVTPERMVKFWTNVDMQAQSMNLPLLPDVEKYRFNTTPEIH